MKREEMMEQGIAVYQVGEVFQTDENDKPLSEEEKSKWFVSVLADSPLAATVNEIPLSDSEDLAWASAATHYGFS